MTLGKLRACFANFDPIRFSLGTIQRFPGSVLYLAPQPDEPFRQLTLSIWTLFPEAPPYGGKWPDIVPHLSIAQLGNEQQLEAVFEDFAQASQEKLPIFATASKITLMHNRSGRWEVKDEFNLGAG